MKKFQILTFVLALLLASEGFSLAPENYLNKQKISQEVESILKAGFDKWGEAVTLDTPFVKRALKFLRATEREELAVYLENIVRQGRIRAGPAKTFYGANREDKIFIAAPITQIKLVVFDHDDTITVRGEKPTPKTIDTLGSLIRKRVYVVDLSGRDMQYLKGQMGNMIRRRLAMEKPEVRERFLLGGESGGLVASYKGKGLKVDRSISKIIEKEKKALLYDRIDEILDSEGIDPSKPIKVKQETLARTDRGTDKKPGKRKTALVIEFTEEEGPIMEDKEKTIMGRVYKKVEELLGELKQNEQIPQELILSHSSLAIDITMTNKETFVREFILKKGIKPKEVLILGDAPNDFGMMQIEGVTAVYVGKMGTDIPIPSNAWRLIGEGPEGARRVLDGLLNQPDPVATTLRELNALFNAQATEQENEAIANESIAYSL